jgi:hypothetical protein
MGGEFMLVDSQVLLFSLASTETRSGMSSEGGRFRSVSLNSSSLDVSKATIPPSVLSA